MINKNSTSETHNDTERKQARRGIRLDECEIVNAERNSYFKHPYTHTYIHICIKYTCYTFFNTIQNISH